MFKHFAQSALGIFPVCSEAMPPQCYLRRSEARYRLDGTSGDHPGLRSGFRAFVQPSCEHFQGWSSHDHVTLAAQCSAALLTTPFVKRPRQTEAVHLSEKFSSHALNVSPVARTQPLLPSLSPRSLPLKHLCWGNTSSRYREGCPRL